MPELAGRGTRDPDDLYQTRPELALLSCKTLRNDFIPDPGRILDPTLILEPTCGTGTWLPGIHATWPRATVQGIEKHPDLAAYAQRRGFSVEQRDILKASLGTYDLIVGNPPYSLADEIIPMLLTRLTPGGVLAFMLRLNFFEGQARFEKFWRIWPAAAVYPIVSRPGFTADGGTDGTAYMLCCWKQGYGGPTVLKHLDNRLVPSKWTGRPGTDSRPAVLDGDFPDPRRAPSGPVKPLAAASNLSAWLEGSA